MDHAWRRTHALDDVGECRDGVGWLTSGRHAGQDPRRENPFSAESRIDPHQRDGAADEEGGSDEEHHGQRNLYHDEVRSRRRRRPLPALAPRVPSFKALVRSGRDTCSAGTLPNTRAVRTDNPEAAANTRRSSAMPATRGTPSGIDVRSTSIAHHASRNGKRGSEDREHETLDHELTNQTHPSRTECGSDRDLALARARTRKLQVGDIGAGDQQHDSHRAEQHEHPRLRGSCRRRGHGAAAPPPCCPGSIPDAPSRAPQRSGPSAPAPVRWIRRVSGARCSW